MPDYKTVRWGILGAGSIAKRFTEGAQFLPDAQVIAVGSRTQEKADTFADQFNIPRRHASYAALVADPDVDVIYVATPHPMHKENSLLALNAGKPVLCEKPFTINAREAEEVVRTAREKRLFLMEGMWSRYFPAMFEVRRLIMEGAIGEVRMLQADFGFRGNFDPKSRLFDPNLGGGALLDVGIYVVSLSSMVLGTPDRITGLATMAPTGVDEAAGIVLGYPQGQIAVLSTAVRTNTAWEAFILGTEGRIVIHNAWWKPEKFTLISKGLPGETLEFKSESTGFNYEAAEVGRCLREGKLESDVMPLDETLSILRTLDSLRAQWGLKYPTE